MNLHPTERTELTFTEARWLYDMGMHETLELSEKYDWVQEVFEPRKRLDVILDASSSEESM